MKLSAFDTTILFYLNPFDFSKNFDGIKFYASVHNSTVDNKKKKTKFT